MKRAFTFAAALVTIAASFPAQAGALWPDVPPEIGVRRIGEIGLVPIAASTGPPTIIITAPGTTYRRRFIAAMPTGRIIATPPSRHSAQLLLHER